MTNNTHIAGSAVVRVCPDRDIECGRNPRAWCSVCPNRAGTAAVPSTGRCHVLKTDPAVYADVLSGKQTHNIRKNDRGFVVGDEVLMRETVSTGDEMAAGAALIYTGRETRRTISHILSGYGLQTGWCILSFAAKTTLTPILQVRSEWPKGQAWSDVDRAKYDELSRTSGYEARTVFHGMSATTTQPVLPYARFHARHHPDGSRFAFETGDHDPDSFPLFSSPDDVRYPAAVLDDLRIIVQRVRDAANEWPGGWSGTASSCDRAIELLGSLGSTSKSPADNPAYREFMRLADESGFYAGKAPFPTAQYREFLLAQATATPVSAVTQMPIGDDRCDAVAARAMEDLATDRGVHEPELNADIRVNHGLRRALVRAGAASVMQDIAPARS
jgi:hypothetical protein